MEAIGPAIPLTSLYCTCTEALNIIGSEDTFKLEDQGLSAQFSADKVALRAWADSTGVALSKLPKNNVNCLGDANVISAVREVLTCLREILWTITGLAESHRSHGGQTTSPPSQTRDLGQEDCIDAVTSGNTQIRDRAIVGKQKPAAFVETFGKLVRRLDSLTPLEDSSCQLQQDCQTPNIEMNGRTVIHFSGQSS